jgi:hypothetical protein
VLEELGLLRQAELLELAFAAAFVTLALLAGLAEGGSRRRAVLTLLLLTVATTSAWLHPTAARVFLLHAHNVVALALWATLFRANKPQLVAPFALALGAAGVLASGAFYQQTLGSPGASAFRLHVLTMAGTVAPFHEARWAVGFTSAFLFLQSLHYLVWLSFIPQEEQASRGTPTFRMSARSVLRDLGLPGLAAVVVAAVAVLVGACFQLQRARGLYLSLATFHTYLELALFGYFWVRPGGIRAGGSC